MTSKRPGPDFIVIGAMKSATTTLHEQLARQPGVFMTNLKEPSFFSDDDVYERGWRWYTSLFKDAGQGTLRGESSTHYAKLPTYPRTVSRLRAWLPDVRLIYVMRHPIERLVSHYVHEAAAGVVRGSLERALEVRPELVEYGRYAMQLEPYLEAFGPKRVLPVFFPRLVGNPGEELVRVGRFLGSPHEFAWDASLPPQNRGEDRLRPSLIRQAVVTSSVLNPLRRTLVPERLAISFKRYWRAGVVRPSVSPELYARLAEIFDADLAQLGSWLGIALDCRSFDQAAARAGVDWRGVRRGG